MPTKDFPLLWKVYDHIVEHPEEWNQNGFCLTPEVHDVCGTTFCFAGHAVLMARPDVYVVKDDFKDATGQNVDPEREGQRVLGLDDDEADQIFYNFTRDPGDIRDIIAEWETEEYDNAV